MCASVCVYISAFVCLFVCLCLSVCLHLCMLVCVFLCVCTCLCLFPLVHCQHCLESPPDTPWIPFTVCSFLPFLRSSSSVFPPSFPSLPWSVPSLSQADSVISLTAHREAPWAGWSEVCYRVLDREERPNLTWVCVCVLLKKTVEPRGISLSQSSFFSPCVLSLMSHSPPPSSPLLYMEWRTIWSCTKMQNVVLNISKEYWPASV